MESDMDCHLYAIYACGETCYFNVKWFATDKEAVDYYERAYAPNAEAIYRRSDKTLGGEPFGLKGLGKPPGARDTEYFTTPVCLCYAHLPHGVSTLYRLDVAWSLSAWSGGRFLLSSERLSMGAGVRCFFMIDRPENPEQETRFRVGLTTTVDDGLLQYDAKEKTTAVLQREVLEPMGNALFVVKSF